MKTLGKEATRTFINLIGMMGGKQCLKIGNEPYMPLTIERIGEDIPTPFGTARLYSLLHFYIQNGDLMQDPEMGFIVVDNRGNDPEAWDKVIIIPYMYQQANLGIYHQSVRMEEGGLQLADKDLQEEDTEFAGIWLHNIKDQGYFGPDCRLTRK